MKRACIGTAEVEGLDGHSSTGKIPYKIFAAGINGATGLILPKTPVSGPNTTPTAFPVFRDDVIFLFSCKICTYNDLRFTFLCRSAYRIKVKK